MMAYHQRYAGTSGIQIVRFGNLELEIPVGKMDQMCFINCFIGQFVSHMILTSINMLYSYNCQNTTVIFSLRDIRIFRFSFFTLYEPLI